MHELFGVFDAGALAHGDQTVFGRHDLGDRLIQIGLKASVAIGHNAHDLAGLDHGQA